MNKAKFLWLERASKSEFVVSVWVCSTPVVTTRPVLADPCISITFISGGVYRQVILRGPETKPRGELLVPGFTRTTIRLRPGVLLRGFPAQKFINKSLLLPVDATGQFWFEGARLQIHDFDNAERLIDQLYNLGYLSHGVSSDANSQVAKVLSARSYARLIKRTTGLSPYQLYQLERIHQALKLLKEGMPATRVAAELNFVDQSHLTHAAKQFLGYTPKQLLSVPQIL
jgi:AraC-like DNA-binding protein